MKSDSSDVIELRQYTLKPGRRDELIDLFEREFIETQEDCGIRVLGQFRDRGRPDHFVWLRGFESLASRATALPRFYTGPAWQEFRNRANDTMIDSDDVMLLKSMVAGVGLPQLAARPGIGGQPRESGLVLATIYLLAAPVDAGFRALFDEHIAPASKRAGAPPLAAFETEYTPNNYPRLPVRTGVNACVRFATFAGDAALRVYRQNLASDTHWQEAGAAALDRFLASPPQEFVLEPTARSKFRHAAPFEFSRDVTGARDDFDFIAGDWTVENRRLRERGSGSADWEIFSATSNARSQLDGLANVEEIRFPEPRGAGMTLRTFDAARRQWSIYWVSSRDGLLTPPVVGGFSGERGLFYGDDRDGDRPVKVRFTWTRGAQAARWEQAFSYDDATWETNWVMEFARR
ncbi:MAG: NIPSNAP family protein [Steroidobacteraceae bacterium]|nr:NIPSNAP family protein [Steroidobacteraceae bacterium]